VLRKYPNAGAVVSFLGLPECNGRSLPAKRPPLLAIEVKRHPKELDGLLRRGIAEVVPIYKRSGVNEREDWFERYFELTS
jgi:hypothetical protein